MWSVTFGVSGMYAKWYMWSVVCRISGIVCMISGMKGHWCEDECYVMCVFVHEWSMC